MSYTVSILFRGLCGFIPAFDDLSKAQTWVGAFLVNANKRLGDSFIPLEIHHPYLKYRTSDLLGSAGTPQNFHTLDMSNLDVAFFPQASIHNNISIRHFEGSALPKKPANDDEREFLNWVPEIGAITEGGGVVNSQCFLSDPGHDIVTARCHLLLGNLRTFSLGKFEGNEIVSQFHPVETARPPVVQALANAVLLEIFGVRGTFTVRMREFGKSDIKSLVFAGLEEGRILKLEVGNLCSEELFNEPGRTAYPAPDFDFGWHYRLSDIFAGRFPLGRPQIPVPKEVAFGGDGGGDFARCTQSRFAAPSTGQVSTMLQVAASLSPNVAATER